MCCKQKLDMTKVIGVCNGSELQTQSTGASQISMHDLEISDYYYYCIQ